MSERLTTLSELDLQSRKLNSKKLAIRKSADRTKVEEWIKSLTSELGKDVAKNPNKRQMLYSIMKEILVSEKGLTLKRGDNASYINALLPKGYHIDFNDAAKKAHDSDTIRIVNKELILSKKGKESVVIWKVAEWGNNEPVAKIEEKKEEPKVEEKVSESLMTSKEVKEIFLSKIKNETARSELEKIDENLFKTGGTITLNNVLYTITSVEKDSIKVITTADGEEGEQEIWKKENPQISQKWE